MQQVAGKLRLDLTQSRELPPFPPFGSHLDRATQMQLARGQRMVELLKQGQYQPLTVEKQVVIIFAGSQGLLDDLPVDAVRPFEEFLYGWLERRQGQAPAETADRGEIGDALRGRRPRASTGPRAEFSAPRGFRPPRWRRS